MRDRTNKTCSTENAKGTLRKESGKIRKSLEKRHCKTFNKD